MSKKVAIFTVIYNGVEPYFQDFWDSLDSQTNTDYDLIIINDGFRGLDKYIQKNRRFGEIIELKLNLSPAENRNHGLQKLVEEMYDYVIFADSDDFFSKNRVEETLLGFKKNDIIVNDISLVDNKGRLIIDSYFSERIANETHLSLSDIIDKNIFGLSNTAIKVKNIRSFNFKDELMAGDWFLFTTLLLQNQTSIFSGNIKTYYRQHSNNAIGIKKIDVNIIKKTINVKYMHYKEFRFSGVVFDDLFKKFQVIKDYSNNDKYLDDLNKIISKQNINWFWWEYVK